MLVEAQPFRGAPPPLNPHLPSFLFLTCHTSSQYSSHAACALTPRVNSTWSSGSPPAPMWTASASYSRENRPACASTLANHPAATAATSGTLSAGAAAATHSHAKQHTRTVAGRRRRAGTDASVRSAVGAAASVGAVATAAAHASTRSSTVVLEAWESRASRRAAAASATPPGPAAARAAAAPP